MDEVFFDICSVEDASPFELGVMYALFLEGIPHSGDVVDVCQNVHCSVGVLTTCSFQSFDALEASCALLLFYECLYFSGGFILA